MQQTTKAVGVDAPAAPGQAITCQSRPNHITDGEPVQPLPMSHWLTQSTVTAYASRLGIRDDIEAALGVSECNLAAYTGTWSDMMAALETYAAQKRREHQRINAAPLDKPLTKAQARALHAVRQDSIRAPGYYTRPQRHARITVRTLNALEKLGLITARRHGAGRFSARSGRKRSEYNRYEMQYRIADRGARLLQPELPPLVIGPRHVRELDKSERETMHTLLRQPSGTSSDAYCESSRRIVNIHQNHVTFMQMWSVDDRGLAPHSAGLLLANVIAYIRLHLPAAVIDRARIFPARPTRPEQPTAANLANLWQWQVRAAGLGDSRFRAHTWIRIVFHLAGEPIKLLPAPTSPPDARLTAWEALGSETQATLLTLYQSRTDGWQRLNGASDVTLRKLNDALLIFHLDGGDLKISSRGVDLVEAVAADGPGDDPPQEDRPTEEDTRPVPAIQWPDVDDQLWQAGEGGPEESAEGPTPLAEVAAMLVEAYKQQLPKAAIS